MWRACGCVGCNVCSCGLPPTAVVKSLPSNLWIMAVLTPVSLVMVLIVMAVALVCRRNRSVFKTSAFRSFHPRTKVCVFLFPSSAQLA